MNLLFISLVISFFICVIISPVLIPYLRKLKFGQQILEDGPNWHKKKSGTPTMGGIAFIIAIALTISFIHLDLRGYIVFAFALLCGVVGFVDDFIKVKLKRNKGFSAKQKTLCLILVIVTFVLLLRYFNLTDTKIFIPFFKFSFDLYYFYYPIVMVGIFYMVNSVNLTDGIDGLATSITSTVLVFLTATMFIKGMVGLSLLSAASLGALIAFLIFNLHPAKVFMGDTGSLFLGALVTGICVSTGDPLLIVILGIVYVIESLSVVIQVASFKLFGRRVFKMSPIHHHFEMCGFSENKIVVLFSLTTLLFCVLGFIGTISF
ncbi:MAG: phospho-N-acetylmuramoyl-pentapeptide-transferase [Ruminococcaceae bacterium]|nr:phospho-N-acetylmuramoyl-pentapeptide-transferase [Oscillospiraceae bacterium]